jgi:hypothetical protein
MCWQNIHKLSYVDNINIQPNTWRSLNEEASEITAGNKQPEYEHAKINSKTEKISSGSIALQLFNWKPKSKKEKINMTVKSAL